MHIILVEDSDADSVLAEAALEEVDKHARLTAYSTGEAGIQAVRDNLLGSGESSDLLVLLDLNLPGIDGLDVLTQIRSDERTRHVPVVVLSSSDYHADVRTAYLRHANAYITKPFGLDGYIQMMSAIQIFWGGAAKLP